MEPPLLLPLMLLGLLGRGEHAAAVYLWAANMKVVSPGDQQCGQRKGQDDGQQPGALTGTAS